MLTGKNVVLGVSGSISAFKACSIVSSLKKLGANVDVIMTKGATEFVAPLSFEMLAKTKVVSDMFAKTEKIEVQHISLATKADIFVVAPATANVIAKFANGIADDMLSASFLACKKTKLVCPAMNTGMLENQSTQVNINTLRERGVVIAESDSGLLACGDTGKGRLKDPDLIVDQIVKILRPKQDFAGKTVLIAVGGTEEDLDSVRVITNHSSGKMGFALAKNARDRGADVVLVVGHVTEKVPDGMRDVVKVRTTAEMHDAVRANVADSDVIIMSAAPADYRPKTKSENKIKSDTLTIEFEKNPDIAMSVGEIKGDKKLIIFSAETENLIENAKGKLIKKHADMVVANDVTKVGAGFSVDTNIASIITTDGNVQNFEIMTKDALADVILDKVQSL